MLCEDVVAFATLCLALQAAGGEAVSSCRALTMFQENPQVATGWSWLLVAVAVFISVTMMMVCFCCGRWSVGKVHLTTQKGKLAMVNDEVFVLCGSHVVHLERGCRQLSTAVDVEQRLKKLTMCKVCLAKSRTEAEEFHQRSLDDVMKSA